MRRQAKYIIAIFFLIHVGLVLRATVTLPGKARSPWPWNMFSSGRPWERVLRATGIDRTGARRELPLHRIFGYTGGASRLRRYHNLKYLYDPTETAAQAAFAAFLARRMAEQGVELPAVDLRWVATNVDNGETQEHVIGTFEVSARP